MKIGDRVKQIDLDEFDEDKGIGIVIKVYDVDGMTRVDVRYVEDSGIYIYFIEQLEVVED
ncbi:hypothetical protein [Capnocytophaga gingivalis]|jgi:hypothetical protein|uniref:hypothetical protein n=1 Tax=Capnocytophaga gingivalis TaxID=1017 RepID=UPI00204CAFF3|nr:MAG TPA: hypothetical protein [Caudoviricetes sp.]